MGVGSPWAGWVIDGEMLHLRRSERLSRPRRAVRQARPRAQVARGIGERTDESCLTRAERGSPGPPPWVRRDRDVWIRLRWEELSGRKLGDAWDAMAAMPVRRVWR